MARTLDFVVALEEPDADRVIATRSPEFYVDGDMAREAVREERVFKVMHLEIGITIDLIVRLHRPAETLPSPDASTGQ